MEKIPASTTTQKGKDPEIPKRKSDLQNEAPKPAEKKIFKAGIIDMQELVDAQARDIGDARMTEDKEDLGKNWLTRNLKRIWKHNMAQEYYRQKEISKIKEQILKTGNLYEGEQVAGGDGANPDHSNIAKKAIIDKFTSDYADEILKKEEKDSTKSDNKFINNKMKDLINEYASGSISEEEFKQKKQDTIELYNPNYTKDGTLYADNLLDIAKEVKDAVDNGQALDKMDFEVNLTLGKARESLDTEAKKTTFDKILNHPIVSKYAIVQTLMQSVAVAGVYSATKYLATGLGRKGAKWLGFGVGMAAGAAIEGAKERARVTRERSQHIRERAKGMQMTEQGMKRREQMEKNRYETKGATEIIGNLDTALAQVGRGNLTESEVREIMTNLSDLEARVRVGGEEKIDLISYESFKNVEKDRTSLLIKAAELKVALRKAGLQMNGNFDDNLESLVDKQRDGFIEEKGTKDEVFRKMRNKKMWA
ncbi:MAG: hypothetical protein QG594_179, partial [Bacteroidota bacterium]|nr:hypothetical protein [Bacteroidota bacterium]